MLELMISVFKDIALFEGSNFGVDKFLWILVVGELILFAVEDDDRVPKIIHFSINVGQGLK